MFLTILEWFRSLEQEEGQTLVEYALIIALIAIVLIAAITALSGNVGTIFNTIGSALE